MSGSESSSTPFAISPLVCWMFAEITERLEGLLFIESDRMVVLSAVK